MDQGEPPTKHSYWDMGGLNNGGLLRDLCRKIFLRPAKELMNPMKHEDKTKKTHIIFYYKNLWVKNTNIHSPQQKSPTQSAGGFLKIS